MKNYQLHKTNCKLGGQIKWNLTIESVEDDLQITDFRLTPISDNIPHIPIFDDNIFNTPHIRNIKMFYNTYQSQFYDSGIDPLYISEHPYVVDTSRPKSDLIKPYDDALYSGLRRVSKKKYGKSYALFCPVWLEDFMVGDILRFDFITIMQGEETTIKTLRLSPSTPYMSKFVKYFDRYINDISIDGYINNKLLNIDLENDCSFINGVDVSKGVFVNAKKIMYLKNNLLQTERLLMDTDSIIINNYEDNNMITPQLFNFNFLFDIEDFIIPQLLRQMWGEYIDIKINVYVERGGKSFLLEKKTFNANYDFIERKIINKSSGSNIKANIFDILHDDKALVLMDKKPSNNIIHWALRDNNDYIFNLYTSFGGLYINSDGSTSIDRSGYQDAPNIWFKDTENADSGLAWCARKSISTRAEWIDFIKHIADHYDEFSLIGGEWCKSIKYKPSNNKKYLLLVEYASSLASDVRTFMKNNSDNSNKVVGTIDYYSISDHYMIFIDKDKIGKYMFANFKTWINDINGNILGTDNFIKDLSSWINGVIEPSIYILPQLGYNVVNGPDDLCDETEYYKTDTLARIIRYDGYIVPQFVDYDENNIYTKKILEKGSPEFDKFNLYSTSGLRALYPSIKYYGYNVSGHNDNSPIEPYEYSWFMEHHVMLLKDQFNIVAKDVLVDGNTYIYNNTTYNSFSDIILKELKNVYPYIDDDMALYIFKQYDLSIHWEYSRLDDINRYDYTFMMSLK